jgi:hypothetical protein
MVLIPRCEHEQAVERWRWEEKERGKARRAKRERKERGDATV